MTNYVDSRTPEERSNESESITTTTSMTNDKWKIEFEKQFAGAHGYINPHWSELIKSFIQSLLDQRTREIVEEIDSRSIEYERVDYLEHREALQDLKRAYLTFYKMIAKSSL